MPDRRLPSVDAGRFAMVPRPDVPRSAFDLIHTHKTTFDAGWLVPVYVDEVLPGDSFRLNMTAFARLATPITPVMDNLYLESFFFFVPYRLVWSNFERFMGEQASPSDTTAFLIPQVAVNNAACAVGTIYDYFGINVNGGAGTVSVSCLPFRAYGLIWNDFFRDEDLDTPVTISTGDGPDAVGAHTLLVRRKRPDYFTTARPWPAKPNNTTWSETMPGSVPTVNLGGGVSYPGGWFSRSAPGVPVSGITGFGAPTGGAPTLFAVTGERNELFPRHYTSSASSLILRAHPTTDYADVRVLIDDLRTANQIQHLMERNARGGTRYAELVRSHFGVVSPDARLQRPEYLGGGRTMVTVNAVAQTSATGVAGTTTVLGETAGIGTAVVNNHGFSQSFTEHGVIIGLINVRADLTYQQGINRMWFRRSQFDFYWPSLAHLGEQAVMTKELYCDTSGNDELAFGFQERWAEYRSKPSRISGRFRSQAASTLDMWHFAQRFTAPPVLNSAFILDSPPVDRVLQVGGGSYEQFMFDSVFDLRCVRPLPMFSIPGLTGRL